MRLAIISDEVDQDLTVAISFALQHGLDGLEIRSLNGVAPPILADSALAAAADLIRLNGLSVAGFCPPALKCPVPEDADAMRRERLVVARALEQAAALDSPYVRIFSFYRQETPDPKRAAAAAREVLEGMDVPPGVTLLLETGTRTHTPTVRLAVEFLSYLDRPDIGILWDPGNTVFSGFDAHPFPRDYQAGRELIRHVHVKDPRGTTGYVRLGEGDLPWQDILGTLQDDNFPGYLSLETHWRLDRQLSPQERDQPWGPGISAGGLAASALCAEILSGWCQHGAG